MYKKLLFKGRNEIWVTFLTLHGVCYFAVTSRILFLSLHNSITPENHCVCVLKVTDMTVASHSDCARLDSADIVFMSFATLPDELLPAVFSHLSPGTLIKLSLVGSFHLHQLCSQ